MGIRESLLNTITSVGNGDFIRIVTSAGASSKATLQNVFKSFESGLGAKSNFGTSDYIRVVGADNNLYKQSLSNVKSAMGVDTLCSKTTVSETTVTGTTNQFGAINLNLPWRNYEIVSIASSNGNQWCIPTIVGASTYARVLTDGASWAPVANTSVSLIVRYRHYSQ